MAQPFTDYVRALTAFSSHPGGEPPDPRLFARLWSALREVLRHELKRRGLWQSSPSYVGIYGWRRWEEWPENAPAEPSSARLRVGRLGALEELTFNCYSFIFVDRLRSLQAQLMHKPDIEGFIPLNARHFLHDLQRRHDPLGYRVFEVARSAVRGALEDAEIELLGGDPAVRNDTVLGWQRRSGAPEGGAVRLEPLVASWNDDLLPDLVTARGERGTAVAERLRRHLPELREVGIASFRFKELLDPLKRDVRTRWAEILRQSADPEAAEPETQARFQQARFEWLLDRVAEELQRLDTDERTRAYLLRLWQFLHLRASESGAGARLDLEEWPQQGGEEQLSKRRVGELLKIPRERLPGLYRTLGEVVTGCLSASDGEPLGERRLRGRSSVPGRRR